MEVWHEIKRLAPTNTFRANHLKRLEDSKIIRKMMKQGYVPAQYASPEREQLNRLNQFNQKLKKKKLEFLDPEMQALKELWPQALESVSSISTVIEWFKSRTREALEVQDKIYFRTCNGSLMTLSYPKLETKRVRVLGYGSSPYRQVDLVEPTQEPNQKKLLNAVTANVTHATDAAALCEALWDCEHPFVAIHDACGMAPGRHLEDAVSRLKDGLVSATTFSVWDSFRTENGLDKTPQNAPPIIGDLTDWNLVRQSNYLYS